MGIKNRERRRAKQKVRQQQQQGRRERAGAEFGDGAPADPAFADPFGLIDGGARPARVMAHLLNEAMQALHAKDENTAQRCCDVLVSGSGGTGGRRAVDTALIAALQRDLTEAWRRGWQPVDVFRVAQRRYGSRHGRIVVDVIAAEMRSYAAANVDERWEAQVRDLGAMVWWERDDQYLSALGEREGLARPELIRCALEVLYVFNTCPQIQKLCPLPGQARRGSLGMATREQAVHARQLDRVRALLAKAESTSYPEEAETYTAKAQELMARYSIDYALLSAGAGASDEPVGQRIGVDNPYEAPKVLLLDAVARANRCRTVWSNSFGFVTVLGFPSDVDGVEILFTSLLVQATGAIMAAGSHRGADGRSSTRSFRQSFLTAYAQRIGERLTTATRDATEQATKDMAAGPEVERLLPVLASREAKVGAFADELFPDLVGKQVAVTNRDGWASGRAAADRARLNARESLVAEA
ncbi:DUF2786 domain-containing protein [Dactylosporangium sp. CA-139066]|uniref:DUF2786 domain-containing protein n=1 Tax=Dactylosporangium sp. CA-139066 TaxID=3239930 RepID=UPI003D908EE2